MMSRILALVAGAVLLLGVPAAAQTDADARAAAEMRRLIDEAEARRPTYRPDEIDALPLVVTNLAKAEKTCADGNDDNLCAWVGLAYLTGTGVPKDIERGRKLVFVACGLSNRLACLIYEADNGGYEPDLRELQHPLFLASCDAKASGGVGCFNAGQQLMIGFDVKQDMAMATSLFIEGCVQGHGKSCRTAAQIAIEGKAAEMDMADGFTFAKEGCDIGDGTSCALAIMASQSGKIPALTEADTARLAQQACTTGEPQLCDAAARYALKNLPDAAAAAQAPTYAKAGCDAKRAVACAIYGEFLYKGMGIAKDQAAAETYWEKACTGRYALGCVNVALTASGRDDFARARSFYEKALAIDPKQANALEGMAALAGK